MINPWLILEVHRKSTEQEIRNSFLNRVRNTHPDTSGGGAVDVFVDLKKAYEMIKDKKSLNKTLENLYNKPKCTKCDGKGVTFKSKGFSSKTYTACTHCGGSGLIF